jgi:ribose 5-phosphate isomerase A
MDDTDAKIAAAREVAMLIEPGMTVGLGSGSTVAQLIEVLGELRVDASFAVASPATARAAEVNNLRVVELDDVPGLDLAIDGADQIEATGWMIKGGGCAHTRERIIIAAARHVVVIVSPGKLVEQLQPPVPLELLAFAPDTTLATIGRARRRDGAPPSPDGGLIADLFDPIDDPAALARRLDAIPGVIAHGLFAPELVDLVIVGHKRGRTEQLRPGRQM